MMTYKFILSCSELHLKFEREERFVVFSVKVSPATHSRVGMSQVGSKFGSELPVPTKRVSHIWALALRKSVFLKQENPGHKARSNFLPTDRFRHQAPWTDDVRKYEFPRIKAPSTDVSV